MRAKGREERSGLTFSQNARNQPRPSLPLKESTTKLLENQCLESSIAVPATRTEGVRFGLKNPVERQLSRTERLRITQRTVIIESVERGGMVVF